MDKGKWQDIILLVILIALSVGATLGIVGCKTRGPIVDDPNAPWSCRNLFECMYQADSEPAEAACIQAMAKNCNASTADNDCTKRFKRLPTLTEKEIEKLSVKEYRIEIGKRNLIEKDIEGCIKSRL